MKKVLIIGGSISQIPTIQEANKKGLETIVIDGNKFAVGASIATYFYNIDIKQEKVILDIAKKHKIDGIIVPGTDFPAVGAYIAEKLNLPSVSLKVAKICSNKVLMRQKLQLAGLFVPNFCEVDTNKKYDFTIPFDYPIVIKPVDNMAARGVKKINKEDELYESIKIASLVSRSHKVIIEEYKKGMELSIDSFVYDGEIYIFAIADRHFALDPYFIEIGHTMPSILDKEIIKEVIKEFKNGVRALGINFGSAKGDVKITSEGIMICEIAARISGGFLSGWTVPISTGKNPHSFLIDISLGQKPDFNDLKEKFRFYSSERAVLSIPGKVKKIYGVMSANKYSELVYMHIKDGDEVFFPINNAQRCGSVITKGRSYIEAINKAQRAVSKIFLRLEARKNITEDFIASSEFTLFEPGLEEKDWHDINIFQALHKIYEITSIEPNKIINNELFWKAFYTGGIQGGVWFVDSYLRKKI